MRNRGISLYLMIIFLAAGLILAVVLFHYDGGNASQGDASAKREVILRLQKHVNSTWGKVVYPPGAPKIIGNFNVRRMDGKIHQGIDIWGLPGQPIIAIADGRVIETYIYSCAGPTVTIDHGRDKDGKPLIAFYVHVQDMLVEEGQAVLRGDLIARMGDNYSQFKCIRSPHLHLELGRSRDAVDGINPHPLWADGPSHVTCFDKNRDYPSGTITYPMPCAEAPNLPRSGRHPTRQSSWFENSVLDKLNESRLPMRLDLR